MRRVIRATIFSPSLESARSGYPRSEQSVSQHQPQASLAPVQAIGAYGKPSRYRFVIGALIVLLNFSSSISLFSLSPVTPLVMEDYSINRSAASLLVGVVILMQTAFAIPFSMIVGRVSLKKLIAVAWLLAAVPSLSFLASSFPILLALRVAYGLSFAMVLPSVGPLLMQWFQPRELPLVNGIGMAAVSLGIAVATFTAAPLAEAMGWRGAVSMFGVVALLGAVTWMLLGRERQAVGRSGQPLSVRDLWSVVRSRDSLLLAVALGGPSAQYVALTAWLPTFYYQVHGMSLTRAGSAVGLLPLTAVFTVLLVGLLAFRLRRRRPFLIIPGILVVFAGFGSFLLGGSVSVYPALVLLGIGSWAYLPVLFTIPMELPHTGPERVAPTFAAIGTISGAITFLGPLIVGAVADASGSYLPGFSLLAVLAGSLAVAGFLLPETGVREHGGK